MTPLNEKPLPSMEANRAGDRIDFKVKVNGKEEGIEINNVQAYGHVWGKILNFLGYASKTETGDYVNTRSFLKHLVFTWCEETKRLMPNDTYENQQRYINQFITSIEQKNSIPDKNEITAIKVENLYKNLQKHNPIKGNIENVRNIIDKMY